MRTWIARQHYLIDFTVSSLARRKVKTLSLLFVYTLLVFLLASVMLFAHALRREAALGLAHAPDVIVQRMVAGRHDLISDSYLEQIASLRGVQSNEGRLWGYYYDTLLKANLTIMVPPTGRGATIAPGRAKVGPEIARELGMQTGGRMVLQSGSDALFTFTVETILPAESALLSADLVLISEEDFRALFNYPAGYYTDLALSVANPQERRAVAARLTRRLPDVRTILREDILRTYESIFSWREGVVLVLLFGVIIAFAIFALDKASGLSADETREIGILKAIGWDTGDVLMMKCWEGTLVSMTAFLLGYVTAYLHVFRFSSALFEPVLKGWSVLYPHFELSPELDGMQIATLFFFTVLPYTAATIVPIWRTAITDPDSVMRG